MRTTLTIDDDIARLLEQQQRRTGATFKDVVNHALRAGLQARTAPKRKPFRVTPLDLHLPAGLSYDNVEALIEALEGPAHK
ncbi:MAG: hypothetical protein RL328_1976 [Acidobacteriota bacterium]